MCDVESRISFAKMKNNTQFLSHKLISLIYIDFKILLDYREVFNYSYFKSENKLNSVDRDLVTCLAFYIVCTNSY